MLEALTAPHNLIDLAIEALVFAAAMGGAAAKIRSQGKQIDTLFERVDAVNADAAARVDNSESRITSRIDRLEDRFVTAIETVGQRVVEAANSLKDSISTHETKLAVQDKRLETLELILQKLTEGLR